MKLNFLLFCLLAVSACGTSANGEEKETETPVVTPTVDLTDNGEIMRVTCSGGEVYVSAALDGTSDIIYRFRKCMANDIFTFYTVGSAPNSNTRERLDPTTMATVTFNSAAASDNIGPMWLSGGNYFVGGNHKWTDDKTKTAATVAWSVEADGVALKDGDTRYAKEIVISVENELYDPLVAPAAGASILSTLLAKESVVYTVMGKSLKVSCSHDFARSADIYRYYGMQSMFINETRMMTPGAQLNDWTDCPQSSATISVPVGDCPDLNLFIERNGDKYFQTTYLKAEGLGTHKYVSAGHPSFIYANYGSAGNGKAYHVLIGGHLVEKNEPLHWEGTYVWGQSAKVDDSDVFCHEGRIDGKRALYVCCTYPVSRLIKVNGFTADMPVEVVDSRGELSATAHKDGIQINATTSGYAIICY